MTMKTWFRVIPRVALFMSLSGCAFTGAIVPNVRDISPAQGEAKLPVRIAVVSDSTLRMNVASLGTIDLNPGLARTLAAALAGRFEVVSITENRSQPGDVDLVAVPALDTGANFQGLWQLTVDFETPKARSLVTQVRYAATPNLAAVKEQEAPSFLGAFVSGLALCIPCPVTLPLIMKNNFDALVRDVADNLPRFVQGVADLARHDTRIVAVGQARVARVCEESEDAQAAIRACSDVIAGGQADPRRLASAFDSRGSAYARLGEIDRAFADLDQAIRLNPGEMLAYYHRGVVYERRRQYKRAESDFDQALTLAEQGLTARPDERLRNSAKAIRERRDGMKLESRMEAHWVEYLKEIQAQNDYPNWPAPPYDAYVRANGVNQ
jgi:tetratricopeptide (TPR) repeat protein